MSSLYSEQRARLKRVLHPVPGVSRLARCNWGAGMHTTVHDESIDDELDAMLEADDLDSGRVH